MNINIDQLKEDAKPFVSEAKYHFEKRKKLYMMSFVVAVLMHYAYVAVVAYNSDEAKRLRNIEKHQAIVAEESEKLSDLVTKTVDRKFKLDYSQTCLDLNKEKYADCSDLSVSGSVVQFYPIGHEREQVTIVPKANAESNVEPPAIVVGKHKWLVNSQGQSKSRAELGGSFFEEISAFHKIPLEYWYDAERKYKIKKEVALCIAWADSGLGKHLKTANNIGNVGNNDRGDRVAYDSLRDGVDAIFKVLNNQYLKHKQSIGSLSPGGGGSPPYYATSKENWDNNVRNCLSVIHGQTITKDFLIRLKW